MGDQLRQIVLDFDGVIADGTNRAYVAAYTRAVQAVDEGFSAARIEAGILSRWGESPRRELAAVMGEGHPGLQDALARYQEQIGELLRRSARPIAGAPEAVFRLADRYTLYIVSGMGALPLRSILGDFGLAHCFRRVISTSDSDLPERQKASGYHLRQLCQSQGLAAGETLCVGDARSDIAMARSCGMPVALVLTGTLNQDAALAAGADWVLPALADLPDFLPPSGWPPRVGPASVTPSGAE